MSRAACWNQEQVWLWLAATSPCSSSTHACLQLLRRNSSITVRHGLDAPTVLAQ